MYRFWLLAVAAGLASAVIFMSGLAGSTATMILANLAPAPLFAAALGLGAFGGMVAAAASTVFVLISGGFTTAATFALVTAVPVALLGRQAMLSRTREDGSVEWYPSIGLLAWLTGIGATAFLVLALFLASQTEGLSGTVRAAVEEMAEIFQLEGEHRDLLVATATPLLPGMAIAMWMLMLVVNGAVAQGLLVAGKKALRPTPDIAALHLPGWIAPAAAAVGLAAILLAGDPGYAARNLLVVMTVPFFLQGISVVHMLARRTGGGAALLAVFYVMLVVVGWVGILIVLLGLLEQFVNLRARMSRREES